MRKIWKNTKSASSSRLIINPFHQPFLQLHTHTKKFPRDVTIKINFTMKHFVKIQKRNFFHLVFQFQLVLIASQFQSNFFVLSGKEQKWEVELKQCSRERKKHNWNNFINLYVFFLVLRVFQLFVKCIKFWNICESWWW